MMDSNRLGGLFLMLGAAAMLSERLEYYDAQFATLARGWHFEVLAMALIGAGALTRLSGDARAGWALAAIGVAAVLPMYPLMIGGYSAAFAGGAIGLNNFEMVNGFSTEIFYVGNLLACAGLALALALEWRAQTRPAPGWLLIVGAIANGLSSLGFLALHAGVPVQLAMVGPMGLIGFISLAAFGAFVAFRKTDEAG